MFEPFNILVLNDESSIETSVSGGTNSFSRDIATWGSSSVSTAWDMGIGSVVESVDLSAEKLSLCFGKRVKCERRDRGGFTTIEKLSLGS